MARITVRNLNDISRRDNYLGQALNDLIDHISNQNQQITTLQSQIAALQKKSK